MVQGLRTEIGELKALLSGHANGNGRQGVIGSAISTAAGMLPSLPGSGHSKE